MPASAVSPVSEAVYGVLTADSALMALATGGWHDSSLPPNHVDFPCGLIRASEREVGPLGPNSLPEVDLRLHIYSQHAGAREAQAINRIAIDLLRHQSLTLTGFDHCGQVIWDGTEGPFDTEVNGVLCHELVGQFRVFAEEQ